MKVNAVNNKQNKQINKQKKTNFLQQSKYPMTHYVSIRTLCAMYMYVPVPGSCIPHSTTLLCPEGEREGGSERVNEGGMDSNICGTHKTNKP